MGIFSANFNRPGPGVPKDAPKKKGIARFFEIFTRDFSTLWKASMMLFLCSIPMLMSVLFLIVYRNYLLMLLIGIVLVALSGLLTGPALCACHSVILKTVRDQPGFFWHDFKKGWKSCWRQSLGLNALFSGLLCMDLVALYLALIMNQANVIIFACVILSLLVIVGVWLCVCLQIVFMTIPPIGMLKNGLLMLFGRAKRMIPATLVVLLMSGASVLCVPIPFLPLVVILGVPGWIMMWADMLAWPVVDEVFKIDEQQRARTQAAEEAERAQANQDS